MDKSQRDSLGRKRFVCNTREPLLAQIFPKGFVGYDVYPMEKKPRKILAENLRQLMLANGLSTHSLKRLSGLPQTTISRALREESALTIDLLQPLAKAFSIPVWALLYPDLDPAALPRPDMAPANHAIDAARVVRLLQVFDSLTDGQQDSALKEMAEMAETNLALFRELGKRPRLNTPKPPQLDKPPSRPKKKS